MTPNKKLLKFWISKIIKFFREKNFTIDPLPTIKFIDDQNELDNILISTGNYDCHEQVINLYIDNRHIKDILRSLCHEMVHHHQNLDNSNYFRRVDKSGAISSNAELRDLEAEAYMLGNLYFRDFTETFTHVKS